MTLLNLFSSARDGRDANRQARQARRLSLEALETRQVLSAVTFTVTNSNDSGAGSLRQAIIQADQMTTASSPVTISFASSLAGKTITPSKALPLLKNPVNPITIEGQNAGGLKIALSNSRVVDSADPASLVNATGSGLYIAVGTRVTLNRLEVANSAGRGFENHGTLTLNSGVVAGSAGGGAVNYGIMTVNSSTLKNNRAPGYGGGVNNYGGSLTVSNSTITGNSAGNQGGGIVTIPGGTVKLTDSNIYLNSAPQGANVNGAVDSTSSNNVIGSGDYLTGISDRPTGAVKNFIGRSPSSQIQPIMDTGTQSLNVGSANVTYRYVYDVRQNKADFYLNSTSPDTVRLSTTTLDLNPGDPGYVAGKNPITGLAIALNDQGTSVALTGGYDAPTTGNGSAVPTPSIKIHVNSGYWAGDKAALTPLPITVVSDTGLNVNPDPKDKASRWRLA